MKNVLTASALKRFALLTFLFVGLSSFAYGYTAALEYFNGRTDGETVTLDWRSGVETNLKTYVIERSEIKTSDFQELGNVTATGSASTYRFRDLHPTMANPLGGQNAKTTQSDMFKYRLKMNFIDGAVSYSQTISVSRPASGVKRTWGMIKEMFH